MFVDQRATHLPLIMVGYNIDFVRYFHGIG